MENQKINENLAPIVRLYTQMFIGSNGHLANSMENSHKLYNIIDVVRADSLESVLHLIGHELRILLANEKKSEYKFYSSNSSDNRKVCNEFVLSGFPEDIKRLLVFRNPSAHLVHFKNRFYGIVVSAKSNYICGFIERVVSSNHKISALIIGHTINKNQFNVQQYIDNKARVFKVTKEGFLFVRSQDKSQTWGFMKNTPDVGLDLALNESFVIINDGKESIPTYWKRKDEKQGTFSPYGIQERVTPIKIDEQLVASDAAFLMFEFQQLIWGDAYVQLDWVL